MFWGENGRAPCPHTQPPTVCSSSGGCTERDLAQAGQRQGGWHRFDEYGQKSPEQRGEVREGLVRAASNLHLSDYRKLPLACLSPGRTSSLYRKPLAGSADPGNVMGSRT